MLTYNYRGTDLLDITAAQDGTGSRWLVTITADQSATIRSGEYTWQAKVSKAGEVYTVDSGHLRVLPNLAFEAGGFDGRSVARRTLERIERVMYGRGSRDDLSYQAPGTGMSLVKMTPAQLLEWYNYWKAEVAREQAAEDLANGKASGRDILVQFARP